MLSLTVIILVHLTGTKLGCAEGGCGACTVMVSQYDKTEDKVTHVSVNACLAPLCSLDGTAVTTVEGIGSTRTSLHPCQVRGWGWVDVCVCVCVCLGVEGVKCMCVRFGNAYYLFIISFFHSIPVLKNRSVLPVLMALSVGSVPLVL